MSFHLKKPYLWISIPILVIGVLPLLFYWITIGRTPSLTTLEATNMLAEDQSSAVLVDVRNVTEFDRLHLKGAEHWVFDEIKALVSASDIPDSLKEKTLLLYCDSGTRSAQATQKLIADFGVDAFNVAGGLESWIAKTDVTGIPFENSRGETVPVPFKESPVYEQAALVAAVFVVKTLYMLGAFALIFILWRTRSRDLAALRWGLIFFLVGETFCEINILFFDHSDYLLEFFHSYGMMVGFGFIIYAVIEALDKRLMHWTDSSEHCTMRTLCRDCIKDGASYCKGERLFVFLIISVILLSFIPFGVSNEVISYNTEIFNVFHSYSHPVIFQMFETWYSPFVAVFLLLGSLLAFFLAGWFRSVLPRILFASGVGAIGFSFLRTILVNIFRDNLVWFYFWEETTELMFIVGIGILLYLFRQELSIIMSEEKHQDTHLSSPLATP